MQVNDMGKTMRLFLIICFGVVNGAMALVAYVAQANFATSGSRLSLFGVGAEAGLILGLAALLALPAGSRRLGNSGVTWIVFILVTLWNQTCLTAFIVSTIPFRLH